MLQSIRILEIMLILAGALPANAQERPRNGTDFSAPTISGTAHVPNPDLGAIVLDTASSNFFGYGGTTPGWILLGGASTVPAGSIISFAGSSAPSGYLPCDGSAVSRTTYSQLFSVIGTTYGGGDGSTTFNVPNAQGVFLRGAGSQTISSVSYSASLGSTQGDQMQGHEHGVGTLGNSSSSVSGSCSGNTNLVTSYNNHQSAANGATTAPPTNGTLITFSGSVSGTAAAQTISGNVGTPMSDGTNGTPRTGVETRPVNLAIYYMIKT